MPTVNRKPPRDAKGTVIQSYLFAARWSVARARDWLTKHEAFSDGIDEQTSGVIRARQYDPQWFDDKTFRIIDVDKDAGVKAVVGKPL